MIERPTSGSDRPPNQTYPTPPSQGRAFPGRQDGPGRSIGPVPITAVNLLIALTFVGSIIFTLWVVAGIDDEQIPLLASGVAVLGASLGAMAISALVAMWRAASQALAGRALGLAIFGGLAGLAAIGCFTVTALALLVWQS